MKNKIAKLLFKILRPYIVIEQVREIERIAISFRVKIFGEIVYIVEYSDFQIRELKNEK